MPYEQYNFISKPSPERHIEKMAVISRLWGVKSKDTTSCNVLELGCGTADNLIFMATTYPNSSFVGVDCCEDEIQKGNNVINELGLKNILLYPKTFSSFKSKIKKYDYIIAHGVFSWVDEKSRISLLKTISKYLSEDGVCYISFNSYPGCIFRDLLIQQIKKIDDKNKDAKARIKNIKDKLFEITQTLQDGSSPYSMGLQREAKNISEHSDSFFVHEILNNDYKSFSLEDFVSLLKKHNLFYLSDASFVRAFSQNYKQERLEDGSFLDFECFIDNLLPKTTRGVLVTKKEIKRKIDLNVLDEFFVSSPFCFTGGDKKVNEFTLPNGKSFEFEKKSEADFFKTLESLWPKSKRLEELNCILQRKRILDFFSKEFINLYTTPLNFLGSKKDGTPLASKLAKIELKNKGYATNFRGEFASFDEFQKIVFGAMDGKNNVDDIVNIVFKEAPSSINTNISKDEVRNEVLNAISFFKETAYLE